MKLGIQLFSVMKSLQKDAPATLKQVADTGYVNFEVANFNAIDDPGIGFGMPADQVKTMMEGLGARVVSAHLVPLTPESVMPVIEFHKVIGTQFLVVPMAFYASREDALAQAANLNAVGKICKEHGFELLYHNHHHEFQLIDGETIYDILLNNTDPALVNFEVDTYWAMRGGNDPVELLKKLGKRVRLIHQKDYPAGMEGEINLIDALNASGKLATMEYFQGAVDPNAFTEIGTGIMDIQGIIDAANEYCHVEYIILEQDASQKSDLESIAISMKEFDKFTGITK